MGGFMLSGRISGSRGMEVCGCYPECRIDCPDREACLDDMPVYQSKREKAQRYAAQVRQRRPEVARWVAQVTRA